MTGTQLKDRLREALNTLDGAGIDPHCVIGMRYDGTDRTELNITLRTRADFDTACRGFRVKPADTGSRFNSRADMRTHEAVGGDLVLVHHCFPHHDCWRSA